MIGDYTPRSGRVRAEDGTTVNIADILGGEDTGMTADINAYTPMSGRMIKEDGTVVNIATKIGSGGSGGTAPSLDVATNDEVSEMLDEVFGMKD